MNVVDSSGWLEYFANSHLASIFAGPIQDLLNLIVPTITCFEVHKRASAKYGPEHARECVEVMMEGEVVPLDLALALEASSVSRQYDLPMADSIVYATALAHGATVWTTDSDFKDLPNVRFFDKRKT